MEVNVKNTNNVISKVYKDSIADELGIEAVSYTHLDVYKRQPMQWIKQLILLN